MVRMELDTGSRCLSQMGLGSCIRSHAETFFDLLSQLLIEDEVELVHNLRVFSRRLNEALALLSAAGNAELVEPHRQWLRDMRELVAPIRDADVMRQVILRLFKGTASPAADKVIGAFAAHLDQERQSHLAEARRRMDTEQIRDHRIALAKAIGEVTSRIDKNKAVRAELIQLLRHRVRRRRKVFLRLAYEASKSLEQERMHMMRIAAKKLRYVLELAQDGGVLRAKREVKDLQALQKMLGDINDLSVLCERLRSCAQRSDTEAWVGTDGLRARVTCRAERLARRFARDWPRLMSKLARTKTHKPRRHQLVA